MGQRVAGEGEGTQGKFGQGCATKAFNPDFG